MYALVRSLVHGRFSITGEIVAMSYDEKPLLLLANADGGVVVECCFSERVGYPISFDPSMILNDWNRGSSETNHSPSQTPDQVSGEL